jgi:tRNA A37 threonylcarbamoyladenosine dehydratase
VLDAIDTLSPKVFLIKSCLDRDIRIISSMGSGGKMDPTQVFLANISDSNNCALARAVRKRLSRLNVRKDFPVVYSTELVDKKVVILIEGEQNKRSTTGTISYMPTLFGCFLASHIIRELIK